MAESPRIVMRPLAWLLIGVGLLCRVVAVVYFTAPTPPVLDFAVRTTQLGSSYGLAPRHGRPVA
jgi:hypothetical protein